MEDTTRSSALTAEDLKSIEDTVARRDKLIEYIRDRKIAELKELGKKLKEAQRVAAKNKAEARRRSKASKKARKVNRRK